MISSLAPLVTQISLKHLFFSSAPIPPSAKKKLRAVSASA
jgi:hypothetical protein